MNGEHVECWERNSPAVFPCHREFSLPRLPDNVNRECILIVVIPDIVYRESLLVSFRMDTCHQHAGMTKGRWMPAPAKHYRSKLTDTQVWQKEDGSPPHTAGMTELGCHSRHCLSGIQAAFSSHGVPLPTGGEDNWCLFGLDYILNFI